MSIVETKFNEDERNSRTLQYTERVLDTSICVAISGDPDFLESLPGQQALITAVNLIARMTSSMSVNIPTITNRLPQIAPGDTIDKAMADFARAVNPAIRLDRNGQHQTYRFHLGRSVEGMNVIGGQWTGAFGSVLPSVESVDSAVGFGACAAVCGAVAHMFRTDFGPPSTSTSIDLFRRQIMTSGDPMDSCGVEPLKLGNLWLVGCGSIGSSALFFLGMNPAEADVRLIDGDIVKNHNLDRAACFLAQDLGKNKVDACERFIRTCPNITTAKDPTYLHKSTLWANRAPQDVDLIIAAANEYGVRTRIESSFPPIQIYATTGSYWQASVWCHIPNKTGCSCCAFPPSATRSNMQCAIGNPDLVQDRRPDAPQNDASLPFLSFFGGLLVAAEIYRLAIGDIPPPRYDLWTANGLEIFALDAPEDATCICQRRSIRTQEMVVRDTRYGHLIL